MESELITDKQYKVWLQGLKEKVRQSQLKAAVCVNRVLLEFYWQLGADIVEKQKSAVWGSGFIKQLSHDLLTEFPAIRGFSERNIKYIRQWFLFWSTAQPIGQQAVAQLNMEPIDFIMQVPWGHNIVIVSKCGSNVEALFYVRKTIDNNWSRNVLTHQIEGRLYERKGKTIHNFDTALPRPQSDLAQQTLKDPYIFDFLTLTDDYTERELEQGLIKHITQFLLELGAGFAYVGKQVPLPVGERDFFLDLLFYHTRLHCYVVVELKTGDFEPEHAGKLNFYLKAVDQQLKSEEDKASIGILPAEIRTLFPDEFIDSDELGWIPKGWEVKPIDEAIEVNPRVPLKKGEVAKFVDMKALPTLGSSVANVIMKSYSGGVKFNNGDVLLARITPCLENGKTGVVDFLDEGEVDFGSTEFIVLRGKGAISTPFIACLARHTTFRKHCTQSMVGSSGRQRVQNACFSYFYLALPPDNALLDNFHKLAAGTFRKYVQHREQSKVLTNLRDTLLPKLLSGEIRIPEAEKMVKKIAL